MRADYECRVCGKELYEALDFVQGEPVMWRFSPHRRCENVMDAAPGTSLKFLYGERFKNVNYVKVREGHEIVEVDEPTAARLRYTGQMSLMEEFGVVAVFFDPQTGVFYGQPAEDE